MKSPVGFPLRLVLASVLVFSGTVLLLPGSAWCQDYMISELYDQLPAIVGSTVTVHAFYTNPVDNKLVSDYELFQEDELMPPRSIVYIDGPAAPSSMWYGAWVSVDGTVDTFHVADPYWPEDDVQIVLTGAITYTLLIPPSVPDEPPREEEFLQPDLIPFPLHQAACDSCKFAVLISGGGNHNHARYWNNLEMLYKLKTDSLGYCKNNVFTLYAKGESGDTTVIPHSSVDSCTAGNVTKAFQEVAKRVAACKDKGKTSKLQVMVTNHGRNDGYIHMLGSGTMSPQSLRALLQTVIDSCLSNLVVEMVQCYGGQPADSLKSLNDKEKTTMNVSSAAGGSVPHRSDVHHPNGGWATYLKVKVDSLKAGASYEDAVRAGLAAYDSLLKAQGLEGRRGKSVHWRNYPMKKYCEWHMIEVPPGGQVILDFSGDSTNCGNCTVYEELADGTKKKRAIWNWNVPGSPGYQPNQNRRVYNADSSSTGRFWIHNDNKEFRVIVTSAQTRTLGPSPTNLETYAGSSHGGDDDSAQEFSDIVVSNLLVNDVDQPGFELSALPQSIGPGGVEQLDVTFTNYGNPYWSNMELWMDVLDVHQPGELWVEATSESGLVLVNIDVPGEYVVPLGGVFGEILSFNPVFSSSPAFFTLDAWGLRVADDETVGVPEGQTSPKAGQYRIYQSYPNPFNPVCTIRYEIPVAGRVSLRIFDVKGSVVRVLVDEWKAAGEYTEVWNGIGDSGRKLASGVYFYELEAGDFKSARKMVLLK